MPTATAEMTKACINAVTLPDIFDFQGQFSYFINISVSVLERLWVKGGAVSVTSSVLFFFVLPIDEYCIRSVEVDRCITYDRFVQLSSSSSLLSPVCRLFTFIYFKQTMLFLEYIVLQLFCIYNLCYLLMCSLLGAESFLKS